MRHPYITLKYRSPSWRYISQIWLHKETVISFPSVLMAKIRTERHIVREKARKRTQSLFRKANELAQIADANIYVVINRNDKYQIYKSTDQPGWPPSEQEMVRPHDATLPTMLDNHDRRSNILSRGIKVQRTLSL